MNSNLEARQQAEVTNADSDEPIDQDLTSEPKEDSNERSEVESKDLRAMFEEIEQKFDKALEELKEHSNNKESNLDDISTIERQESGESNPFNKSSLSKLKLNLDELDLSMSIWEGHFLDVKYSALSKAKRAEAEFDEKKLGEKKFSLLGSKITPFIKIVEA